MEMTLIKERTEGKADLKVEIRVEVSQKDKYHILTHIYGTWKDGTNDPMCRSAKETQM